MVLYFTLPPPYHSQGFRFYAGKDKYENEDLIKWGWPKDVWFHVVSVLCVAPCHLPLEFKIGGSTQRVTVLEMLLGLLLSRARASLALVPSLPAPLAPYDCAYLSDIELFFFLSCCDLCCDVWSHTVGADHLDISLRRAFV